MPVSSSIEEILYHYWGFTSFRYIQKDIIQSVMERKDTLGLMPTGGGKSIAFQVPAMSMDGMALVVTPIISLMKDQVDNLLSRKIKATYIHAGLSRAEMKKAIDKCIYGSYKFLYISPERLKSQNFMDQVRLMPVNLIVVDEAHCISQWGYDFRPSFLTIADIRKVFPQVPVLALTATATPPVVEDIMDKLEFRHRNVFSMSFERKNLSYIVRNCEDKVSQIVHILNNVAGSGIVYVRSRQKTKQIANELQFNGISADYYHAGLSIEDKEDKQNKWKSGESRIIVATNAFGMGIDKADVRIVVHADFPSSLEEYYQEAGRAGRDGNKAYAVLLSSNRDKTTLKRRLNDAFPSKDFIKYVYQRLGDFLHIPIGGGYNEVFDFNFNLFCKTNEFPILPVQNALRILSQAGYIEYEEEVETQSRIMILADKSELYNISSDNPNLDHVLQAVLRQYTGLFSDYVFINEDVISRRYGITQQVIYDSLIMLSKMHILHYVPRKRTPYVVYTTSREEPRYVLIPKAVYEDLRRRLEIRINSMLNYAFSKDICRENYLLNYFGEASDNLCGRCDFCINQRKEHQTSAKSIIDGIIYMSSLKPRTMEEFIDTLSFPKEKIIDVVTALVEEGYLVHLQNGLFRKK